MKNDKQLSREEKDRRTEQLRANGMTGYLVRKQQIRHLAEEAERVEREYYAAQTVKRNND